MKNDWALTIIECRGLKKTTGASDFDGAFSQQFRPFAFALGGSENGVIYNILYRVVCEHLQNLYGYTLKIDAICQDHSAACATAARDTWTETCSIILCWPHISRNAIATNRDKLSLAEDANLHITYVHHSRSQKQFEKQLGLMLAHWTDDLKEEKLALWFKSEYGTGKWTNWHVTSSRIPGFTANV